MKLTLGFDDEVIGQAILQKSGKMALNGDKDRVKRFLSAWPELEGEALLKKAEASCTGRMWANLEE